MPRRNNQYVKIALCDVFIGLVKVWKRLPAGRFAVKPIAVVNLLSGQFAHKLSIQLLVDLNYCHYFSRKCN